jgi:penicillin-binding protein 1B
VNYGKKYYGEVPLYFALKNSLNAATASIGMQSGIENLVDNVQRAGEVSPLKPFPSLTLGAFELYPT